MPLPTDAGARDALHDELHARPPVPVRLPALVVCVAVLNDGIDRQTELAHLRLLPGAELPYELTESEGFLGLRLEHLGVRWERHSEYSRYTIVQTLPDGVSLDAAPAAICDVLSVPADWIASIPGRTISAVLMPMLHADLSQPDALIERSRAWLGDTSPSASRMGNDPSGRGHSLAITAFRRDAEGFERIVVLAPPATTPARAGRISQRLLELTIYRTMALLGLATVRAQSPTLAWAEQSLADITAQMADRTASPDTTDRPLLERLIALAAELERSGARDLYRYSASGAYHAIVQQRIVELRERPVAGTLTLGDFMQRRLSPAMATVQSTARRMEQLSDRVTRTSDLLRTRVNTATEEQNRELLRQLTHGQALQLQLQTTVEGLSIAAISYYVISLLLYGGKALKAAGVPLNPELAAGVLVPFVMWGVWTMTRRIHARLHAPARH